MRSRRWALEGMWVMVLLALGVGAYPCPALRRCLAACERRSALERRTGTLHAGYDGDGLEGGVLVGLAAGVLQGLGLVLFGL